MEDRTHLDIETRVYTLEREQHWTTEAVNEIKKEVRRGNNIRTGVLVAFIATLLTIIGSVVIAAI